MASLLVFRPKIPKVQLFTQPLRRLHVVRTQRSGRRGGHACPRPTILQRPLYCVSVYVAHLIGVLLRFLFPPIVFARRRRKGSGRAQEREGGREGGRAMRGERRGECQMLLPYGGLKQPSPFSPFLLFCLPPPCCHLSSYIGHAGHPIPTLVLYGSYCMARILTMLADPYRYCVASADALGAMCNAMQSTVHRHSRLQLS